MTNLNYISKEHWGSLYRQLYAAYDECGKNHNETYRQMLGEVLDHMITNKPYLVFK